MQYGSSANPVSDNDVKTILQYASDALIGKLKDPDGVKANVTLIEEKGKVNIDIKDIKGP